jgi:hypothetical protein
MAAAIDPERHVTGNIKTLPNIFVGPMLNWKSPQRKQDEGPK